MRIKTIYILFLVLIICLFLMISLAIDQDKKDEYTSVVINWLPYHQGLAKSQIENKPTIIYFYSEQCILCNKFKDETFIDKKVREYLAKNYSLVRVEYNSSDIVIEAGEEIKESQLFNLYQIEIIPTIWFLDSDNRHITALQGYVSPEVFIEVLHYIKGQFYKNYTFQEYMDDKNK